MEDKIKALFDYQKFANNEKLASVIGSVLEKYSPEDLNNSKVVKFERKANVEKLSDDDLFGVNAAGVNQAYSPKSILDKDDDEN
ncbi:MAG: hypothetical protein K6A23_01550 [Butyrivibrio sp.]|nr:hypothetical protein [Butyrivibrio sp.]